MNDALIKKRLGQYFSGRKVADLLVALCAPTSNTSVIDPMAGNGDMLVAAVRAGVPASNVNGIEIDREAALKCKERVAQGHIFPGDAFSIDPSSCWGKTSWDLVITNPPYVRYQSMSKFENAGLKLKSAQDIRVSVGHTVSMLDHLSSEEKACFHSIIKAYSGLSDLAVPSWLLCAALVKPGGTLAMVVPEAWMNREYALSIKYMLLKLFDIQYIVEDVNASWFPEALVKTNLLVAGRVALRNDFRLAATKSYRHIKLSANLAGESSLVARLRVGEECGITAFRRLFTTDAAGEGFESKNVPMSDFIAGMLASSAFDRLIKKLEPSAHSAGTVSIPLEISNALNCTVLPAKIASLSAWGIQIGQGLRTGANKFFYAECVQEMANCVERLRVDRMLGSSEITVAQKYTMPVLRYQSEACDKYAVSRDMLPHRLLYIQAALFDKDGGVKNIDDTPLANHITASDAVTFERGGKLIRFRDLSAVKPNIRTAGQVRYWYMLPTLAKRHLPQLCVARINYKKVRCLLVDDGVVVDANFSTLWSVPSNSRIVFATLALMNSSWVQACLESMSTVMGGGALKVESSHLRALPLPPPTEKLTARLYALGQRLAHADTNNNGDILLQIDEFVLKEGLAVANPEQSCERLRAFVTAKVTARKR